MKTLISKVLAYFGYVLVPKTRHAKLQNSPESGFEFHAWLNAGNKDWNIYDYWAKSKSQIRQDLFVVGTLNGLRNGFFVEFGATNGVDLSNTFLLETEFDWEGILAEPARIWQNSLQSNRNCNIDFRCVWSSSGEKLKFHEVDLAELSTLDGFSGLDSHARLRENSSSYEVESVSLQDLLETHDAPAEIDYLSLDTEGSEYEILKSFDFSSWLFRVITVEHNYTQNRNRITDLLNSKGYVRVLPEFSKFDDWYVHRSLLDTRRLAQLE